MEHSSTFICHFLILTMIKRYCKYSCQVLLLRIIHPFSVNWIIHLLSLYILSCFYILPLQSWPPYMNPVMSSWKIQRFCQLLSLCARPLNSYLLRWFDSLVHVLGKHSQRHIYALIHTYLSYPCVIDGNRGLIHYLVQCSSKCIFFFLIMPSTTSFSTCNIFSHQHAI